MPSPRLQRIDDLVREMSCQDDPDRLVRVFNRHNEVLLRYDGLVTVSCRDLEAPWYRITRSWRWPEGVNPWAEPERLPLFDRGLPGELLYVGRPALLNHLEVEPDDPAREHFEGMRSLACAPAYERGKPVYMALALRREPEAFVAADVEKLLLHANLLGRAATNLLLAGQLREAYQRLDYEMRQVGRMQHHLLPNTLPQIEGLELAASYFTCSRAGGDYYDVLPLPEDLWGLFLAGVAGHGVAAAVVMAMLHTLLHSFPGPPMPPAHVLSHLNRHLMAVAPEGMFATAFYGVYDPVRRRLRYAVAGHPPPRLRHAGGSVQAVEGTAGLPLGVMDVETWTERELALAPGDALMLYTDGIIEGTNAAGEAFGTPRLDEAMRLGPGRAGRLVEHVERRFHDFTNGAPEMDDRTLLTAVAVP